MWHGRCDKASSIDLQRSNQNATIQPVIEWHTLFPYSLRDGENITGYVLIQRIPLVATCAISVLDICSGIRPFQIQTLFTDWMCTKRHGEKLVTIQPVLCVKEQSPCSPRYSVTIGMEASKSMPLSSMCTWLWRSSSAPHAICSLERMTGSAQMERMMTS